ncbi:MAG: SUMF1/EgtB/PvdO family nonheme iron enzyme [Bacteroidales bacterium]|nr:SUMF1/EgtB/PvdO family nonheme iron enzyme [Bacteroidales bacterium]
MKLKKRIFKFRLPILLTGIIIGSLLMIGGKGAIRHTSTNEYCQSCHIHTDADGAWPKSTHYHNESGVVVGCVECHLPPEGSIKYLATKVKTGLHDLYAFHFKDHESFNWEQKSQLEHAVKIVFNESCLDCHQNLFPKGLTEEGGTAHLYYEQNAEKLNLQCINCHLDVGHFNPDYKHERMTGIPVAGDKSKKLFTEPASVTRFENYTEYIPNTAVSFNMVAVKGGDFSMGSPEKEAFRRADEGPVREVSVSSFFMGETEVSWDEFWTFYGATMSEGRIAPNTIREHNASEPDAISGPTPPFGIPDQGWGGGARPAITMTHYAAQIYCQWLSKVTGKKYRLPTEAEWEYACRAGTETPYFFEGDPKRFSSSGIRNKIFGADTANINSYIVYSLNSEGKTHEPSFVAANPFGLKNMSGNVFEYCLDWYSPDAYAQTEMQVTNPKGPSAGTEHVIRGGSYVSEAGELRAAARASTSSEAWLITDPQQPKSLWWYSDMKGIGFRVVCEPDSGILIQ